MVPDSMGICMPCHHHRSGRVCSGLFRVWYNCARSKWKGIWSEQYIIVFCTRACIAYLMAFNLLICNALGGAPVCWWFIFLLYFLCFIVYVLLLYAQHKHILLVRCSPVSHGYIYNLSRNFLKSPCLWFSFFFLLTIPNRTETIIIDPI